MVDITAGRVKTAVIHSPQEMNSTETYSDSCYMGQNKCNLSFIFIFIWLLPFLHLSSIHCSITESLDAILHEHAVRVMSTQRHRHTDELYNAALPAYLAGMQASVISLRSRTLWRKGANFSHVTIPANTLPVPHVKRLVIVYHNLGNWSSSYYSLPGYTLITPVLGFHVYDASSYSNLSRVDLNTNGKPISVEFNSSSVSNRRKKCTVFGADGGVFVSEMRFGSRCYSRSEGHFSVVIPVRKKETRLLTWTMGFLAGLIMVGVAGVMAVRSLLCKRNQEMADEGECLHSNWIGSSKMPRAEVTRTHPVLESTTLPNPKMSCVCV